MKRQWPALDCHAHVDPAIDPRDALALRAVVFAATRSLAEYQLTTDRSDPVTVWGVGVHPGVPEAIEAFTKADFIAAIQTTPLVCEVGLDGKSDVPLGDQLRVLNEMLDALADQPRLVSVHSAGATGKVLDALERRPVRGIILHWWRGSKAETERAVELGCRFSINAAEINRPAVVGFVPIDRILIETDYPYGRATRPGDVEPVEAFLDSSQAPGSRERSWRTLSTLVSQTATTSLFSTEVAGILKAAVSSPHPGER